MQRWVLALAATLLVPGSGSARGTLLVVGFAIIAWTVLRLPDAPVAIAAAIAALLGGRLNPRYDIVMQYVELDRLLASADLVLTAEDAVRMVRVCMPLARVPVAALPPAEPHVARAAGRTRLQHDRSGRPSVAPGRLAT